MTKIETEKQFEAALARIEELIPMCGEDVPDDDPRNLELNLLANLVADYEDEHVVIEPPTLPEIMKLKLDEMGLTQKAAASLLGISAPHMCEIMNGHCEPSLSLARTISQKLDILPSIVLGV